MDSRNDNEAWRWKGETYFLRKDSNLEIPPRVVQNEDETSFMFNESTPIRSYGDIPYHGTEDGNTSKEIRKYREGSSQGKRRRMLQFDDEVLQNPFCDEDMSSNFLKSKERDNPIEEAMFDMSQWVSGFADTQFSCYEGLDTSSADWLADCFNDKEMHNSPDYKTLSGESFVQTHNPESCYKPPECEAPIVQVRHPPRTNRHVIFKAAKSYLKTPTKNTSSVVFPFAYIKPCEAHGDITLKDINKKIHTPPPSKSKEDDLSLYPMSAFSGKPVVVKTKIRTEGGKGSITIMRTKG